MYQEGATTQRLEGGGSVFRFTLQYIACEFRKQARICSPRAWREGAAIVGNRSRRAQVGGVKGLKGTGQANVPGVFNGVPGRGKRPKQCPDVAIVSGIAA